VRVSNISGSQDSASATVTVRTPAWSAYHDTIVTADDTANVTLGSVSTVGVATALKNYATGNTTAVTLTGTLSAGGSISNKTNGVVAPSSGTDAYNAFNGIITFSQSIDQVGAAAQYVTFSFSGVDTSKRYTVAFYTARNAFTTSSKFTILGVTGYQSAHSFGVGNAGDSNTATVDVNTGTGSTAAGMLVKWVDIQPSGTSFSVRVDGYGGTLALIPVGILLQEFSAAVAAPTISTQPVGSTVAHNASASMSVAATGTGLSYQWYEGASGVTANPVSGAISATLTTSALTTTTSFWARITNAGGSVDSQAATITVLPPPTPLESWAGSHSLSGPDAAAGADPDGDGIANLVEFALGSSPTDPGQAGRPSASMPAAYTLGITFHRATAALRYIVESSTTLAAGSWTVEAMIEKNTDPASVGNDVQVEVPMGAAARKFLRLHITE
jgi:hypothetical protein